MALLYASPFSFGAISPIWGTGGFYANTTVLDADNGDDVDGNGRYGLQLAAVSNVSGTAYAEFTEYFDPSPDYKLRIGLSLKHIAVTKDGTYVYISESGQDGWGWGINESGGTVKWELFWYDQSGGGYISVATSAGALTANAYYFVTLELDPTPTTDSTANAAEEVDNSETAIDVTDGAQFTVGNCIKIDDEKMYVSAIVGDTLTVTRGIYCTTAATHSNGTDVYHLNPTAALYASNAGGETNVIPAQQEPAGFQLGTYSGAFLYHNYDVVTTGKGVAGASLRMGNIICTDGSGSAMTGRVAWADRHVIEVPPGADVPHLSEWTKSVGVYGYRCVDDYNEEAGCASVGDSVFGAEGKVQLFDMVNESGVISCMVYSYGSSPHADYRVHVDDGEASSDVATVKCGATAIVGGQLIWCYRLRQTPGSNAWSDAKWDAFLAGGVGSAEYEEFEVACVGTALTRPTKNACPDLPTRSHGTII